MSDHNERYTGVTAIILGIMVRLLFGKDKVKSDTDDKANYKYKDLFLKCIKNI